MNTILERIASGERAAVDECVREYGGLVWRLARRYLDRADAEVEDAVQDVFIEIWRSAHRYEPAKGSEPAFVATLAHRRLIDRRRQVGARRRALARHEVEVKPPLLNQATPAPERRHEHQSDDRARVAAAFDGLPETEREALWMSVYRGMSHREIGVATESPIGTVKTRLRRATIRLSEAMRGDSTSVRGGAS